MMTTAFSSCGQNAAEFRDMNVERFAAFINDKEVQLLDVRTPEEFAEGHIAGAVNIDVFNPAFVEETSEAFDPQRPVAVYCRSGRRSADAAAQLAAKGYDVTNLEGGILAWEEAGKPVEK